MLITWSTVVHGWQTTPERGVVRSRDLLTFYGSQNPQSYVWIGWSWVVGRIKDDAYVSSTVRPMAAPEAKSAVFDCILFRKRFFRRLPGDILVRFKFNGHRLTVTKHCKRHVSVTTMYFFLWKLGLAVDRQQREEGGLSQCSIRCQLRVTSTLTTVGLLIVTYKPRPIPR